MNDRPRRRRSDDEPERGGLPLFPLVLIVIFAGLLLGGVLAHFLGGSNGAKPKPAELAAIVPTAVPTLAIPAPSPRESFFRSPKPPAPPSAVPSASPGVTPSPTTAPTPTAKPHPTPARALVSPKPTSQPVSVAVTPAPAQTTARAPAARVAAAVTPGPNYVPSGADQAAGIVRSYLGALARGDRATATSYLARGLPGEVFMDSGAKIVSVHSSGAGTQYKVSADVQAGTGEYYVTFTLEPGTGGLQITDHYAIKVR